MVRIPSRFAVRATRQAISPRLAIRTEANMPEGLASRWADVPMRQGAISLRAPRRFAAVARAGRFAAAQSAAAELGAARPGCAVLGPAPDAVARAWPRPPAERRAPGS